MRKRDVATLLLLALGLVASAFGGYAKGLRMLGGACLMAALLVGASRFLRMPVLVPLPGLFTPLQAGQRWCASCGRPAPGKSTCPVCGAGVGPQPSGTPDAPKRRAPRLPPM